MVFVADAQLTPGAPGNTEWLKYALPAKARTLNCIGLFLNKAMIARVSMCSVQDLKVSEVLIVHLNRIRNGLPGVFGPPAPPRPLKRPAPPSDSESSSSFEPDEDDSESDEAPDPIFLVITRRL